MDFLSTGVSLDHFPERTRLTRHAGLDSGGALGTSRLATLSAAGDQDVQAGDHRGLKKTHGGAGEGPEAHQVLEVVGLDHELSNIHIPVLASPSVATTLTCRFASRWR